MLNLKLNLKNTGVEQKAIMKYKEQVEEIHQELHKRANDEIGCSKCDDEWKWSYRVWIIRR